MVVITRPPRVRHHTRMLLIGLLVLGLWPLAAGRATATPPAGVSAADWQAIQALLPPIQQAYLKASNAGADDQFGRSVAIDGDTVVIGAVYEDSSSGGNAPPNEAAENAGAAYVFVRVNGAWTQQAYLKAANPETSDRFGRSVAVSGDTIVVGASGEDSSSTGVNSVPNEAAPDAGAAYVFVRSGTIWTQQAYLKAANVGAEDIFGSSVAISGNTVVVGANGEDSSSTGVNSVPNEAAPLSGATYVFVRSGTIWTQQAYLKASNPGVDDGFGRSVAISGDTVVVSAPDEDSSSTGVNSTPNEMAENAGAAYVFVRVNGAWSQQAYLKAANAGDWDFFGRSVAISGNRIVVGAPGGATGAAYVFVRSGVTFLWSQHASLQASNPGGGDRFGGSVAVSGDTIVVGASGEDSSTPGVNPTPNEMAEDAGAAYVFIRSWVPVIWIQHAYLKASNPGVDDSFGTSVAVSGNIFVVGAPFEASSSSGVNSMPNEMAPGAGAAYVSAIHAARLFLPLLRR